MSNKGKAKKQEQVPSEKPWARFAIIAAGAAGLAEGARYGNRFFKEIG